MPEVTVPCRPSGEPIAMTGSPTASLLESPSVATVSGVVSTLMHGEIGGRVAADELGRRADARR